MKCTMKVHSPRSLASAAQEYVGERYLRHNVAIWELPTTRFVEIMVEEHGVKSANPLVTPARHTTLKTRVKTKRQPRNVES